MVRKQKKGRLYTSYRQYTNNAVQKAVLEILEQGTSIRSASEKYGVPKSTLNDRLQRTSAGDINKQIQQGQEEEHLSEVVSNPTRLCIVCHCRRSAKRSFHRFPKSERRKNEWIGVLQLEKKNIAFNSSVCSRHFRADDYCLRKSVSTPTGAKRYLRTDAVPSLFLHGEDEDTSVFPIEKEDNSETSESLNQSSTDNEEFINIEVLQNAHIKLFKTRIAKTEAKVEENLYEERKRKDTWDSDKKQILQAAHVKLLEKRLVEEERKVQELENHCKNLCDIVKFQNETISELKSKLKLSEKQKSKIQRIKVQEIVTTVAIHNPPFKKIKLSESD